MRVVAALSMTSLPTIIAIWALLLEDAAHKEHRGQIEIDADEIDAFYGLKDGNAEVVLSVMVDRGLLTRDGDDLIVTSWEKRQFATDVSDPTAAERQRKQRSRNRHAKSRPDTDSFINKEKEIYKEKEKSLSSVRDRSLTDDELDAIAVWNTEAKAVGLPTVRDLNDGRKRQLAARLSDLGGVPGWKAYLQKIVRNDFLTGRNGKWRASFDWCLKPANITKVMEGNYDGSSHRTSEFDAALADSGLENRDSVTGDSGSGFGITIDSSAAPHGASERRASEPSALDIAELVSSTGDVQRENGCDLSIYRGSAAGLTGDSG